MNRSHRASRLLVGLIVLLGQSLAHAEGEEPDAAALIADMYRAQVPRAAQYSRVHVTTSNPQPGGGRESWDLLVLRKQYGDGPRSAITFEAPDKMRGVCILSAPQATDGELGLWLYSPEEKRARQISPLDPDDYFLSTKLNYEDLALAERDTQPPHLIGREDQDGRTLWKVEARPRKDRFYSRIVTWVDDQSRLPVKREYFDRTEKLWKVASYRHAAVDGQPTVVALEVNDVQSRAVSVWKMEGLVYGAETLDPRRLDPSALGRLADDAAWSRLAPLEPAASPARASGAR
ncbi:MAG: outer membrane lipoprotein-sorting protein [Gammaproteobacteria bacterium]